MLGARGQAVLPLELGTGFGVIAAWGDGGCLANVAPAAPSFGAGMLGAKIAPLTIHLEMRHRIACGADRHFQLVAAAVRQPTGQTLTLLVVFGGPFDIVAVFTQRLDLRADRIVLAVGDFFSDSSNICHDDLLHFSYFAE